MSVEGRARQSHIEMAAIFDAIKKRDHKAARIAAETSYFRHGKLRAVPISPKVERRRRATKPKRDPLPTIDQADWPSVKFHNSGCTVRRVPTLAAVCVPLLGQSRSFFAEFSDRAGHASDIDPQAGR